MVLRFQLSNVHDEVVDLVEVRHNAFLLNALLLHVLQLRASRRSEVFILVGSPERIVIILGAYGPYYLRSIQQAVLVRRSSESEIHQEGSVRVVRRCTVGHIFH